jgi:hypothetical protein
MFGMISNATLARQIDLLRAELHDHDRASRYLLDVNLGAVTNVAAAVERLKLEVKKMASQLDDEFEGLRTGMANLKTVVQTLLEKVQAVLDAVDLSAVETEAQGLVSELQTAVAAVQAAVDTIPDVPVPPVE